MGNAKMKSHEICGNQELRSCKVHMLGRLHKGGYMKTMKAKMLHKDQEVCENQEGHEEHKDKESHELHEEHEGHEAN